MDKHQSERILQRGVSEVIVESELVNLLASGESLRLKMGFDPSAPDLHFGHAVGLRKLRQLQDMGHRVIVIVGDWTAQIGDPSGTSSTRPMLTAQQVSENAKTYLDQFYKIVDRDRTETRMQSEWFDSFNLENVIQLTSRFTVAQFLARDDFSNRFHSNQPIAITEFLYPLLQAYDSVAIESDVEFGGTDQKFNLLVGRDMQKMMGQRPQQCLLMPILVGTDGSRKMSKSLGNYIGIDESPEEMYGKIMSIPDTNTDSDGNINYIITDYFEYLTDIPESELIEMRHSLKTNTVNPMGLKKYLARTLVEQFHDQSSSLAAENTFELTVQRREIPEDLPTYDLPNILTQIRISDILLESGLATSSSSARRLINQGAVRINDESIRNNGSASILNPGDVIRVGKRQVIRVR